MKELWGLFFARLMYKLFNIQSACGNTLHLLSNHLYFLLTLVLLVAGRHHPPGTEAA